MFEINYSQLIQYGIMEKLVTLISKNLLVWFANWEVDVLTQLTTSWWMQAISCGSVFSEERKHWRQLFTNQENNCSSHTIFILAPNIFLCLHKGLFTSLCCWCPFSFRPKYKITVFFCPPWPGLQFGQPPPCSQPLLWGPQVFPPKSNLKTF